MYANLLKEKSPHEKAIARDLGRTFPHHAFFNDGQGVGQESLFNVLKAYSMYVPSDGFIAAQYHIPDLTPNAGIVKVYRSSWLLSY
jgi:hypothetical protein